MNPKNAADGPANTSKGRILLADDDDLFREGLALRLRRRGYECFCAANATQAADLLRQKEYEVLLADIYMPGNVGLELIQDISQIRRGLPVILLTGLPTVNTAMKSIKLSVAGYLAKPPDMDELHLLLQGAISNYRSFCHISGSRKRLEAWARQLALVEGSMHTGLKSSQVAPVAEYLQLMASNLMSLLGDMEHSLNLLTSFHEPGKEDSGQEFLEVMRRTIRALEQTKQCFKSKNIGQIRHEIEALVEKYQPKDGSGER